MVFKREFSDSKELSRTGQGAKLSLRFAKGNWFVRVSMEVNYPVGFDDRDFEGMEWNTGLGVGRVIPMGKRIQSVVLTTWNPAYSESKSLENSPFQLKIGFELFRISGIRENLKSQFSDMTPELQNIPSQKTAPNLNN